MAYRLIVNPEAKDDLAAIRKWYDQQRSGLGKEFLRAIHEAFDQIRQAPLLCAIVHDSLRLSLVKRFPHVICYLFEDKTVYVLSIYHSHRDPHVWQSRGRS